MLEQVLAVRKARPLSSLTVIFLPFWEGQASRVVFCHVIPSQRIPSWGVPVPQDMCQVLHFHSIPWQQEGRGPPDCRCMRKGACQDLSRIFIFNSNNQRRGKWPRLLLNMTLVHLSVTWNVMHRSPLSCLLVPRPPLQRLPSFPVLPLRVPEESAHRWLPLFRLPQGGAAPSGAQVRKRWGVRWPCEPLGPAPSRSCPGPVNVPRPAPGFSCLLTTCSPPRWPAHPSGSFSGSHHSFLLSASALEEYFN